MAFGRPKPLRVLIAPDKFKGTLSAPDASAAIASGVRDVFSDAMVDLCPVADGGEGTLDALQAPLALARHVSRVTGPLGEPVDAAWGINQPSRVAVLELAEAAGLWRVPSAQRDPTRTTTFGVAELVMHAVAAGATRVLIGLGGSATCDGGFGVALGLGATFRDEGRIALSGRSSLRDGAALVARVEAAPRVASIEALCDVDNILLGPRGAARAFGPQKGASPTDVEWIESMLERLAVVPVDGRDVRHLAHLPGAGAAGGVGFGLSAWCGATLVPGAETILDAVRFDERAATADLVITGEGRLDESTFEGKVVGRIVRRAARLGRSVIAVVGSRADGFGERPPSSADDVRIVSVSDRVGADVAMSEPAEALREATRRVVREAMS